MKNFRERVEYVMNGRQCGYTSVDIPEEFIRAICSTERPVRVKVSCDGESITIKYYDERAEKRKKWVDEMEVRTQCWGTTFKFYKDITIAVVVMSNSVNIGISRPAHGDEYDRRVGKAVAFAKAMGEPIPNYI